MTVSLQKGQSVSLTKQDGTALTSVVLGLGWDAVKSGFFGRSIDLDASAILYFQDGSSEVVYYGALTSRDGAVRHTGDNLTGAGEGDDEQIMVELARVDAAVTDIVFTINSYSGHTFDKVKNVFARVLDSSAGAQKEVVRYNLAEAKPSTANVIAKVSRDANGWSFSAIGEFTEGKTVKKLVEPARRYI